MPRSIKEWKGKTDDAMPPPRVRTRIYERGGGRCHVCGKDLTGKKWATDHVKPLAFEGTNTEGNLAAICTPCHVLKTGEEAKRRAKADRQAAKHTGAKRPAGKMQSRGWGRVEKTGKIDKSVLPTLQPKRLYQ